MIWQKPKTIDCNQFNKYKNNYNPRRIAKDIGWGLKLTRSLDQELEV